MINVDFPVNLSLYLNRMRSGIKKYISIFIAEDARHADRLIYVLNERICWRWSNKTSCNTETITTNNTFRSYVNNTL
jgi:hypothetical protein